jgi:hypothetical protein
LEGAGLADEKYLTEGVKYYTEIFRLVWISILAIGGGSTGLLLGGRDVANVIVGLAGIFSVGILVEVLRRLNNKILDLLKKLKEATDA